MLDETAALPEDPEELRAFTARLLAEVKAQAVLIEKLRHQLAGHARHRFGASSETAEQLQLALETSEIAAAAMTARLRLPDVEANGEEKDRPKRRPTPDHVPRMEVELSSAADACADCGGRLRRIGEDVTEELEYVPGRFIVNRIVRPRLACTGCERFVQAPLPSRPIERGRPGPGLLAHVLVGKYADHLPLYRQSQIFERDGLDLDRSTLADWVGKTTALLAPLADAIGRHVLAAGAIFADDTPIRMLAPGTGKTRTARLWTYARDERPWGGPAAPAAWYRFSADRKGEHPKDHLARFRGFMHADGYAGFDELYRSGAIREVACMAHVRRKFVDVHRAQASPIAEEAIQRIARLYAAEKQARGSPPERRVALRQATAAPVFHDLEAWLREQLARISGKSPLAAAIRYALARMERMRPYLDNGTLELDNNTAERGMRAIALGRKNHLFVGSEAGGKAAAIAYTLIDTAKLNDVDPEAWLADTIARTPDYKITKVDKLLPWNWNR
jgi:transposase